VYFSDPGLNPAQEEQLRKGEITLDTFRDMMRQGGRRDTIDLWEPLRRITSPTLLVRGADSDVLSVDVAKRMIDALPEGRLVEIPGAGHPVPMDQPEAFARAVRAFLGA
jgi:pimeloyl-ACP methyl ester carboxylesterase